MHSSTVLLLLGASCGLASPAAPKPRQDSCATGVHIILARGTNEVQNQSIMEETASAVIAAIPGSDVEEVVYPATDDLISQQEGYDAAEGRISDYASSCPDTALVLMGFSQGAWIMTDIACGKDYLSLPGKRDEQAGLARRQSSGFDNVIAVVTHGDPTHVVGFDWDIGTSIRNGVYARQNAFSCPEDSMRAYCDFNDPFCDSGLDLAVHFSYNAKYKADTASFVQGKFGGS